MIQSAGPKQGHEYVNQFHAELVRRIVKLLREKNCPAGHQLKEQWLSDELGVSRSPIRSALRLLERHGIARIVANQGAFLVRDANDLDEDGLDLPATGAERLYNALSRDRFARRLDRQINVTELMRRYGVGRTVVERVLARFAEEGLVEREAGRGWRFLPTVDNPDVYEESYRFRLIVEPMAIMDPRFSPDPRRLRDLKESHAALIEELGNHMPSRMVVEADAEFHETIGAWSCNRFILQAIQQQTRLRRLMEFQYSMVDPERMMQSCMEHLEILEAIEGGDRQRAVEVLRHHIGVARDIFPDFIER